MAAATVSTKVRAAHRGRNLLIALESAVVGLSSGIAVLAVGSLAHVEPGDPQTAILLGVVGILGGVSWWLERNDDTRAVARSIDRRSGWKGALTTAFESESTGLRTPVAAALAQGLAPLVSTRRYLAGEARASAAVLAAPFLALACLGAIREGLVPREDPGAAAQRSGTNASAVLDRAAALRARARALASAPGVASGDAAALDALAQRAAAISAAPDAPRDPRTTIAGLEAEFARLAREIEASRAPGSAAGVASATGDGTMGGRDVRSQPQDVDSMRTTHPPAPVQTQGAPAANGPAVEGGVGAPRWWPEHYDGVVQRWIEARRAATGGRTR